MTSLPSWLRGGYALDTMQVQVWRIFNWLPRRAPLTTRAAAEQQHLKHSYAGRFHAWAKLYDLDHCYNILMHQLVTVCNWHSQHIVPGIRGHVLMPFQRVLIYALAAALLACR